jgi:TatD DNase family protein
VRKARRDRKDKRSPAIFHWYSGSIGVLTHAIALGHYFSVNPAMLKSPNGQRIIARIPRNRLLTETDGPFVSVDGQPAEPHHVRLVEEGVAQMWGVSAPEVRRIVAENFRTLVAPLGHGVGGD